MKYRPDIDGLRALAVTPVVIFHFFPQVLPGGFLGVDVFFVISGYLMAGILLAPDAPSIKEFYIRRAKRILPAFAFVSVAIFILSWRVLDRDLMKAFGESLIAQGAFSSNIYFWAHSGYFSDLAETAPFLHAWSLAVEEQYYLVFPFLVLIIPGRLRLAAFAVLSAVSLIAAQIETHTDKSAAFYLMPFRAWELLTGAMLVALPAPKTKHYLSVAGLLLIALSYAYFNPDVRHPSLKTLPIIVGTALVLRYTTSGPIRNILAWRPMVFIGLISYSLYLWHWPLLVLMRLYFVETPLWAYAVLLVLIVPVSAITWRFVEQPFRHGNTGMARSLAPLAIYACVGGAIVLSNGLPFRLSYPPELLESFSREPTEGKCVDNLGADVKPRDWFCELTSETNGHIDFIVMGDSHAYAALPAFRHLATERAVRAIGISASGCPPLIDIEPLRGDQNETNCARLNDRLLRLVQENHPKTVYLVARWTYYTEFGQYLRDRTDGASPEDYQSRLVLLRKALQRTVDAFSSAGGGTRVVIVAQVPMQKYSPRKIYKETYLTRNLNHLRRMSVSFSDHLKLQHDVLKIFEQITGAVVVDPTKNFCDNDKCDVGSPTISYYSDIDHLSISGSKKLVPLLETAPTLN